MPIHSTNSRAPSTTAAVTAALAATTTSKTMVTLAPVASVPPVHRLGGAPSAPEVPSQPAPEVPSQPAVVPEPGFSLGGIDLHVYGGARRTGLKAADAAFGGVVGSSGWIMDDSDDFSFAGHYDAWLGYTPRDLASGLRAAFDRP